MRTLVWVIGGVVLVDVSIVAWFVVREVIEARRVRRELERLGTVRREIEQLDALWRAPAVPQLRLVHSAARGSATHDVAPAPVTRLAPPVRAARPRARQASLAAFAAAMTALLVVLAFDASAPAPERATTGEGSDGLTWTFEPEPGGDDRGRGSVSAGPSASAPPVASPPSASAGPPVGGGADAPAPDQVAADAPSADRIVLAWEPVPEADGYVIERWDAPVEAAPGWVVIGETEGDATTFVDTEVEPETTYYYRVSAMTEEGPAPSDVVSATTPPGPPDAPVIVAASNGSTIKLEWGDVSNETGYRVERSDPTGDWVSIATVGQDVTVYVDGGLEKGSTYSYRVVATNENGESVPSNVVSATAGSDDDASTDPGAEGDGAASTEPTTEEIATPASPESEYAEPVVPDGSPTTLEGSTATEEPVTAAEATLEEEPAGTTSEDGAVPGSTAGS